MTAINLSNMENSSARVTCKLTAPEFRQRKATLIKEIKRRMLSRHQVPDGFVYMFENSSDNLGLVNDFVAAERLCCDFLSFHINTSPGLQLTITGPEGTKDFVSAELGL